MPDQIAVVQFTTPASPGTLDITDPSITEAFSCAVFLISSFTNDSADNTHGIIGAGFCTANANSILSDTCAGTQMESGSAAADTGTRNSGVECISIPLGTAVATAEIVAAYSSSISGGVRLNFTTTLLRARGTAILFAGLDESDIDLVLSSTTPTAQACTSAAAGTYEPDLLIWIAADHAGGSINEAEAQPNMGFSVNGGAQVCSFINVDEINPTDADGAIRSDAGFGSIRLAPTNTRIAEYGGVTAFTSTGFTHSSNRAGASLRTSYLAIKFSGFFRAGCVNEAVSGSSGVQNFTGLGFPPLVVLGQSSLMASVDTLIDGGTASSVGQFVTGGLGSRAYTAFQTEGVTTSVGSPTVAGSRQEDVGVLTYDHLGAVAHRATWNGAVDEGFSLNFTTATAGFLTCLGIQLGPVLEDTLEISDSCNFMMGAHVIEDTQEVSETCLTVVGLHLPTSDTMEASETCAMGELLRVKSTIAGTVL